MSTYTNPLARRRWERVQGEGKAVPSSQPSPILWTGEGVLFVLALGFYLAGCAGHVPPPVVKPPPPVSPVIGTWENTVRGQSKGKMIFKPGGELQFQGGMDYYNPGRWDFDPGRHELHITLPQADDNKLQIFKMYVGDGVKSFDRVNKEVTYAFDDQTGALNVGGWMFYKAVKPPTEIAPEPTLR